MVRSNPHAFRHFSRSLSRAALWAALRPIGWDPRGPEHIVPFLPRTRSEKNAELELTVKRLIATLESVSESVNDLYSTNETFEEDLEQY